MLRCADNSFYTGDTDYTGHTDNLAARLNQHVVPGTPSYTSFRLPVKLVWTEEFPTRLEALQAERQIEGWSRAKKEALIRGDWDEIKRLAHPRPSTSSGRTVVGSRSSSEPEPS
jgi:predicted GIY-YIG superfamily endonuclease